MRALSLTTADMIALSDDLLSISRACELESNDYKLEVTLV